MTLEQWWDCFQWQWSNPEEYGWIQNELWYNMPNKAQSNPVHIIWDTVYIMLGPGAHPTPGGGTRSEKWWRCAAGRWKLDPKRSREKWNLGPKRSNSVRIGSFNTTKDRFGVGGWEKIPQKDRARSCQSEKRGSKPRHICITHHIGSTPPGIPPMIFRSNSKVDQHLHCSGFKYTLQITMKFCTHHDSVTVLACAKFCCDH